MSKKYDFVLIDTSCFILLDKIGALGLLPQLFGKVEIATTHEVLEEFEKRLPDWVHIKKVADKNYLQLLELDVDKGEASIMALALENGKSLVILDDLKARKLARNLHLRFTGTLGLLLKAKQEGLIPSLKSQLEKIQGTNFRFSNKILGEILRKAGELK